MSGAFRERYGPCALVAGASEGIGAEFARQLAGQGLDLLLVARRPAPLEALADEIRAQHRVEVATLARDVSRLEDLHVIVEAADQRSVGLVVCNAALSPIGEFIDQPIEEHLALLDVNCRAAVVLGHCMASAMVERGRGGLIFLSSLAGLQGTAMTAHYAASKAYLRVLAEGLWDELRPRGVDVLAVLAGPTATPGYLGSKPNDRTIGSLRFPPIAEPRAVVRASLASLGERPVCIPGALNTAIAFAMQRLVPTRVAVGTVSRATRRLYRR